MFVMVVASIWVSVSLSISVGLYYTHNSNCLWAFIVPALISISSGTSGGKKCE